MANGSRASGPKSKERGNSSRDEPTTQKKSATAAARKKAAGARATQAEEKIDVLNVNVPSYRGRVDRARYEAMLAALEIVLPTTGTGLTQAEMRVAVVEHLPEELFPRGAKAAWWVKTVQLDQEARGAIVRDGKKPLRWRRARS